MSDTPIDDGSDKPLGYVSDDGELEVRDFVDGEGIARRGYCETELGQHQRWMRGAPDLFEKHVNLQATVTALQAEREQLRSVVGALLDLYNDPEHVDSQRWADAFQAALAVLPREVALPIQNDALPIQNEAPVVGAWTAKYADEAEAQKRDAKRDRTLPDPDYGF